MATVCKLRYFRVPLRLLVSRTLCTSENSGRKSNVPSFDSREVASILKKITGRNLDKIFSARKQEVGVPSYKLMTDAEFVRVNGRYIFTHTHSSKHNILVMVKMYQLQFPHLHPTPNLLHPTLSTTPHHHTQTPFTFLNLLHFNIREFN